MTTSGHDCAATGCTGLAVFGFGSALKGTLRFACRDHLSLIGWETALRPESPSSAGEGRTPVAQAMRPSHPSFEPAQGRLL